MLETVPYLKIKLSNLESKTKTIGKFNYINIAAAVAIAVMGQSRFKKLMQWALNLAASSAAFRFAGLLAILFGGFLIYAVV